MSKKPNKYEIIHQLRESYPTIESINPKVEKIIIDLDFSENYEYKHDNYSIVLKPEEKAFSAPDCINQSCTKGYYPIYSKVYQCIKDKKSEESGRLSCERWQDEERRGNHQCLSRVSYHIRVFYYDD